MAAVVAGAAATDEEIAQCYADGFGCEGCSLQRCLAFDANLCTADEAAAGFEGFEDATRSGQELTERARHSVLEDTGRSSKTLHHVHLLVVSCLC